MEKTTKLISVSLSPKQVNQIIKTAAKFVISDTLRPALTGLLFEISKEKTVITGCDARRIYSASLFTGTMQGADDLTVILDPVTLKKAIAVHDFLMFAEVNMTGEIVHEIRVTVNGAPVRVIDAKYPDYRRVIPENNSIRYTFDRVALMRTARAGAHISGGEKNQKINRNYQIIYDFNNAAKGSVKFQSCCIDNRIEIAGTIGATWPGSDKIPDAAPAPKFGRISFNGHLLADILQALECDSITLLMGRPNRAVLLETGYDAETVLIMPLLIGE